MATAAAKNLPDAAVRRVMPIHERHELKKSKNLFLLGVLLSLVAAIFGITLVKY